MTYEEFVLWAVAHGVDLDVMEHALRIEVFVNDQSQVLLRVEFVPPNPQAAKFGDLLTEIKVFPLVTP